MDEGYRKVMEILETNRFRRMLGPLDYSTGS